METDKVFIVKSILNSISGDKLFLTMEDANTYINNIDIKHRSNYRIVSLNTYLDIVNENAYNRGFDEGYNNCNENN